MAEPGLGYALDGVDGLDGEVAGVEDQDDGPGRAAQFWDGCG
ncbi:hypothetical protein ABTZ57_42185 [Streptomyces sp. NPDC094048]